MPVTLEDAEAPAVRSTSAVPVRAPRLVERAVFVGGLPGCGKTMLTPIVGSLRGVEIQKFNYALEHLCALRLLGRLEAAAATVMIRLLVDADLYHLAMAREANFRPGDLSSVFRNPGPLRYLRRLFGPGDAEALERLQREHPILHITMHNVLALSPALVEALGDAVRVLEMVRHPLYMVKQWRLYVERYGTDARDLTVWCDWGGRAVPFFARGWEARYLESNPMDRSIFAIEHLHRLGQEALDGLPPARRAQVLRIPFEPFVLDPWPWLRAIEAWLGTVVTRATTRELARQRVPRRRIADGLRLPIYRANGWRAARRGLTERQELASRRAYAAAEATEEGLRVLDRLCSEYEAAYWTPER